MIMRITRIIHTKRMAERTGTSTSSFIVLYCTIVYCDGCMHVRTCVNCTNMISMMLILMILTTIPLIQ